MKEFNYPLKNIRKVRENPWFCKLVENNNFGSKEFNELLNMLLAGQSEEVIRRRAEELNGMRDDGKRETDNGLDDR